MSNMPIESIIRNARLSLRQIRRNPAFASAVILTLGLAIGANTAIFSFVNALLIRPFPFRDPDQLFQIQSVRGGQLGKISMREVLDIQEQVTILDGIAAHTGGAGGYNFSGDGPPQEWRTILTTGNLFEVLGAPLEIGLTWPDHADRQRDFSVILSYGVWKSTFGGRRDVLGKKITLDHAAGYQIHGVTGRGFDFPQGIQVYRSLGGLFQYDRHSSRSMVGICRVKHPFSAARLQAELDVVSRRLAAQYPETNAGISFRAISFRELYSGDVRPYLLVLLGAVGFVLLIACGNVVNLLLSRGLGRQREMAVRMALGAGRRELLGQLLTECVVLSFAATAFGLVLAYWWMNLLRVMIGPQLPTWMAVDIDGRVLAFTALVSVAAGICSGLAPALRMSRGSLSEAAKEGARGTSAGRDLARLRDCMVISEVAVAVVLLAGAGQLIHGLLELQQQQKGFRSDSISTFRISLGWKRYIDQPSISRYYEQALGQLGAMSGVQKVAFISNPPLARQEETAPDTVQMDGQSIQEALKNPYVNHQSVSESYFDVMGIPLKRGRVFSPFDRQGSEPVAIISERLAKLLWADKDPVGQRLVYNPTARDRGPFRKIVGVVGNVQQRELGAEASLDFYVPYRQEADSNQYMLVKTNLGLAGFTSKAERAMWSIDPEQSVFDFATYEQRILDSIWPLRLSKLLLVVFGTVAVVLAAIGIYGVMSYLVGQRRREMGVRLALGASPARIWALVVGRGVLLGATGLFGGLLGSIVLGRILQHVLPSVGGGHPLVFAGALAVLFVVVVAACALPAWRASRIDPAVTLRQE